MSALTVMEFSRSVNFQDIVRYFVIKAAIAVTTEADTTLNHAARLAYAKEVLAGQHSITTWAAAVATNPTVAASIPNVVDNDIEFTVNSMFDSFTG